MDITLLVKSIAGLVGILGLLIFFFLYMQSTKSTKRVKKKIKQTKEVKKEESLHLDDLLAVIRRKSATTQELSDTLDQIIKHYGKIHPKLGIRTHPDFDIYSEILFRICRHPNTNKDIIIKFDKELEKLNPEYVQEINEAISKGLNSRGF